MTRLWNDSADFADEMIDGFVAANGRYVRRVTGGVARPTAPTAGALANGNLPPALNTPEGTQALTDSRSLRRAALLHKVPYYTTIAGAVAASQGIRAYKAGDLEVRALQDYFA